MLLLFDFFQKGMVFGGECGEDDCNDVVRLAVAGRFRNASVASKSVSLRCGAERRSVLRSEEKGVGHLAEIVIVTAVCSKNQAIENVLRPQHNRNHNMLIR